jgi:DNA/RNA endonuclease G (NUC1)/PKD repeat protein
MSPSTTRALRFAALGLALVACNADRALAPSAQRAAPTRPLAATAAAPGSVIITEFLPDPNGTDTFGEWFELYNPGTVDIDLAGWTIGSFLTEAHTIATSVVVPAGKCVVLGNNADVTTNGGVPEAYSYGSSGSIILNNGGTTSFATDWIALRDGTGAAIDSVAYGRYVFDPTLNRYTARDTLKGSWSVSAGTSFEVADVGASRTVVANNPNWVKSTTTYVPPTPTTPTLKGTPGTCPGGTITPPPQAGPVTTVVISPLNASAAVGGTRQFTATASDANGVDATATTTFNWTSSDESVATIAANGLATGVALGSSTITVTSANGVSTSTTLTVVAPTAGSVSLSMNTPRTLIVGYTKPVFPTVRDANNAVITPTPTLVWSSSDPSVATVDELGYVTAVAAGSVTITATAASGAFGTVGVTVMNPEPVVATYRNHLEFGAPSDADPSDDIILAKTQYVLSYNASRGGPNWVSWNLNGSQFGSVPRCDCFSADATLPSGVYRVVDFDYRNGGYDRGHMVQSESRTTTLTENSATFLLTNILPQAAENNQGPWSKLENELNDSVRTGGKEIYVVAGGIYSATPGTLKNEGKVAIPDYTWKVAVIVKAGQGLADVKSASDLQVIAIRMPNLVGVTGPASATGIRNLPWQNYVTTVDALEQATGYDLLVALPDGVERVVESNDRAPVAALSGPSTGVEGASLTFDASGSTDPDGDALTYAWTFGDGSTATGPSATHAYADDGTFTVSVTVTDSYGAASTATRTVTVSNAAPAISGVTTPAAASSVGVAVAATVTFTDAGSADTHDAVFQWGDGQSTTVNAGSATSASANHTYANAGIYTVTVTVRDDDGGSVQTRSSILVVYDAAAGALNGSGWIPATSGGKTSFAIDVRYTGGTTPAGTFSLAAPTAGLTVTGTTFDWLVVEGSTATVRGTGTTSNGTTVAYQVTARDGKTASDKDRIRFRVWNPSTGTVLYDSEPSATDFAAPTTVLNGNLTVHD